jgi:membrane protease YdiL (CAAX protease family)
MAAIARETSELRELFRGPARYVPSTPWGPVSALIVTAVACLASLTAFFGAVAFALAFGNSDAEVETTLRSLVSLSSSTGVAVVLLSQLISLAVVWLAAGRAGLRRETLRLAGLQPGWGTSLLAGFVLIALSGALEFIMYRLFAIDLFGDTKWLSEGLRSPLWWGTALIATVVAPVWEELTFRGFLLSALAQSRLGFWGGALLSDTLWTALHWGYSGAGLASVFAAGLMLSWLVWRTGAIRIAIVAHAAANVAALLFTFLFAPAA